MISKLQRPSRARGAIPGPAFIELFAGCGGLSLGLEAAGFRPLAVTEINKDALATYVANRSGLLSGTGRLRCYGDTRELRSAARIGQLRRIWKKEGLRDIDLLCGGPPCQGYSSRGRRRTQRVQGAAVPSNYLYRDMADVIEVVRPRLFLFENVYGLLHSKWTREGTSGEVWQDVLSTLCEIPGYVVAWDVLRACDYGVPQLRRRVLAVGVRDDVAQDLGLLPGLAWSDPTGPTAKQLNLLPTKGTWARPPHIMEAIGDLMDPAYEPGAKRTAAYPHPARTRFQKEMRPGKLAKKGAGLEEQEYSVHLPVTLARFQHMLENGGEIPEHLRTRKFSLQLLPARWPEGTPSITATSLPDDLVHYGQPRILTVREWARLQTFPDTYVFHGNRVTGGDRRAGRPLDNIWERDLPKYTQIGNAVPVRMARAIGEHLKRLLLRLS